MVDPIRSVGDQSATGDEVAVVVDATLSVAAHVGAVMRSCRSRCAYCFGEVRVAALALLTFTALSGWRSCGIVITKCFVEAQRSGRSPDWLKMKNLAAPAVKREAEEEWGKKKWR